MRGRHGSGAGSTDDAQPLSIDQPRPVPDFFRLAVDIAWALDDWHRRVGPHTALSPHTIRVDRSGAVQLMPATGPADPDFAAPEQTGRLERGADERSDLYSLGALYYRLLTGQPPFQAGTPTC
jgi:serine/threonine protein kinase